MADSTVRFTLSWGEMKLELEGDAAPTLAELQNIRASRRAALRSSYEQIAEAYSYYSKLTSGAESSSYALQAKATMRKALDLG